MHDAPPVQAVRSKKTLPNQLAPTDSRIKLNRVNILALDLGTKMGWASYDGEFSGGTVKFQSKPAGVRYIEFRAFLDTFDPQKVYYEKVRRHKGVDAAHVYGGFEAYLQAWCAENKIPYEGVEVGQIKKDFTGSGRASKDDMIAAATKRGHTPKDDNHADAIAILYYALRASPVRGYSGAVR